MAVALATALVVAVGAVRATLAGSLTHVMGEIVGLSDLRIRHEFGGRIDANLLDTARVWPGVAHAAGSFEVSVSLRNTRNDQRATVTAQGVELEHHTAISPLKIVQGRSIQAEGETVIDPRVGRRLDAQLGDELAVIRFGQPVALRVVGILDRPALGVLQQPTAVVHLPLAQELAGLPGLVDQVEIQLARGVDAEAFAAQHQRDLPKAAVFRSTAASSAGVNRGLEGSRLALLMIMVLVFFSAGFIILTSLTTAVTQRMRELAILRCIGTGRAQIALSQLLSGGVIAGGGALLGVPLGLLAAFGLYTSRAHALKTGFLFEWADIATAVGAALLAGLLGAAYPAALAASVQPLTALSIRGRSTTGRSLVVCTLVGAAFVLVQPLVMLAVPDEQRQFWLHVYVGLPCMFVGWFLLSVPVAVLLGHAVAPALAVVLRVPATLLRQSVLATPLRHGFTGGALMVGLAILLNIWTAGRGAIGGYFTNTKMPDAFVHSYYSLTPQQWEQLQRVPAVTAACPTTMFPVHARDKSFGLANLSPDKTQFVSSDIEAFIAMTDLQWVQGDPADAVARMKRGRAILVSNEYTIAHGTSVGDTIELPTALGPVEFDVVGVVKSPGLDVAVHVFGIQRAYADASISCVFGTREDAKQYFGVDSINLVLLSLDPAVGDDEAIRQIRERVPGVIAGLSRTILRHVTHWLNEFMSVASGLALAALVIACLGVGNMIVANLAARQFEYGVLRAMGAQRSVLARLILGETVIIALVGCVVGTALGTEMTAIGQQFHERLVGITYSYWPAPDVLAAGWAIVLTAAVLAALPAIVRLIRTHPRVLLAAGRAE